jgi:hypothetical protein
MMLQPRACTPSVTFFQAAICSAVWMPGVAMEPVPWTEIWVASVMISPAPARWV